MAMISDMFQDTLIAFKPKVDFNFAPFWDNCSSQIRHHCFSINLKLEAGLTSRSKTRHSELVQ